MSFVDAEAGTELLTSYEAEFKLVQADLTSQLEQIGDLSGEARKAALSKAQRACEEAVELVDQMKMEKLNIPSGSRTRVNQRIRNYESDVDAYKRKLQSLAEDRSALFGNRYQDYPGSSSDVQLEQRQQLLGGTDRLDRSTQRLKASQALAVCSPARRYCLARSAGSLAPRTKPRPSELQRLQTCTGSVR